MRRAHKEELEYVPTMQLSRVSRDAISFHFRVPDRTGWAIATVNNTTGELAIQSDWGTWTHRWNVAHIRPSDPSMLHFIGTCDVHYLGDKLTYGRHKDKETFDPRESVRRMQAEICRERLEDARGWLEWYRDDQEYENELAAKERRAPERYVDLATSAPPSCAKLVRVWCYGREEHWPLTKITARSLFRDVGKLADIHNPESFVERFLVIPGHEWITNEPWEGFLVYGPSHDFLVLTHAILPALIQACRDEVSKAPPDVPPVTNPQIAAT